MRWKSGRNCGDEARPGSEGRRRQHEQQRRAIAKGKLQIFPGDEEDFFMSPPQSRRARPSGGERPLQVGSRISTEGIFTPAA